jgi:hypothetical protein
LRVTHSARVRSPFARSVRARRNNRWGNAAHPLLPSRPAPAPSGRLHGRIRLLASCAWGKAVRLPSKSESRGAGSGRPPAALRLRGGKSWVTQRRYPQRGGLMLTARTATGPSVAQETGRVALARCPSATFRANHLWTSTPRRPSTWPVVSSTSWPTIWTSPVNDRDRLKYPKRAADRRRAGAVG